MKKTAKKLLSLLCAAVMLCSMLPVSVFAVEGDAAGVSLTVDNGEAAPYSTIAKAVTALKAADAYTSATITISGEHEENVALGGLSNITLQGASGAVLKGTLTTGTGSNITITGIKFVSVLDNAVGYYDSDTAINMSGASNVTVSNCTFTGYNYVSNYYANASDVLFSDNTVTNCVFFLHTSDGGVINLSITGNTIIGTENSYCASLLGGTTIEALSGNTFRYAYFGLQNCESIAGYLSANTYDYGYLADDSVDYGDDHNPHHSEATLMTVLPEGAIKAVWSSTYENQATAIAVPTEQTANTITFEGDGAAVGYSYNTIAVNYEYPDKESKPGMDKEISKDGEEYVDTGITSAAGDTVYFKLTTTVPEDLKEYTDYPVSGPSLFSFGTASNYILTIHDEMAPELKLDPNSFVVKVGGTELASQYYTVATDSDEINDGCTFEVLVDLAGMYNNDVITEKDLGVTPITVTYTAKLADDAAAGTYRNTAWTDESEKDVVTVDTYGIKIFKYDQAYSTQGLAGAEFELKDSTGAVIATLTSGADGYVTIEGLDAGTYILTETKAPTGYVKSDESLTINLPGNSNEYNIATVKFANTKIPSTGGMGTTLFTLGGGVLIAAAGAMFVISRKKKENA